MPRTDDQSTETDPERTEIYQRLQEACKRLEALDDHAIAAVVSHAMAMLEEKYGVGTDHLGCDNSIH